MKLTLSENIRRFRKEKKLTQEKLAEALGVTVGAVYKWENALSVPEIDMIVALADLFDTSVDALLGYRMQDNRLRAILDRIAELCRKLDPAALTEAEKALAKYPHSFRIVHLCAMVYLSFGACGHDKAQLTRALELMETARTLLAQNDDPCVSDAVICGDMATARFLLGEREEGIELMKKNNAGGMFSDTIGAFLAAYMGRPEEASEYLSGALLDGMATLMSTALGYVFVFRSRGDREQALAIARWSLQILTGLKTETGPGYLDKVHAEMLTLLACTEAEAGMEDASSEALEQAVALARRYDDASDFAFGPIRFAEHTEHTIEFDVLGATAEESVETLLGLLDAPYLSEKWKELRENEI